MVSKTAVIALVSGSLVAALPGYQPPWPQSTCSTIYSTSYYTIETEVPIIESKTIYIPTTTTIEGQETDTSYITKVTNIISQTPTCITTSYPVTVWVTKEIETEVPVTYPETCIETVTTVVPTCTTVVTSIPSVESCTEYTTSCITTSSVCSTVTCAPCEEGGKGGPTYSPIPGVTSPAGGPSAGAAPPAGGTPPPASHA